ncbi:phage portal protein [Schauerella aestuarii]|uniref:phage portal protein n=1 Tax=Schauerella aestuarii TaxID=2511204 RepID=UPI00136C9919|nr:phage portal protein [Achromobacter aestuarii]MYZ41412.1 phage portal protein [Achromobacter aestuarii]
MRLFGLEIKRAHLAPAGDSRGWFPTVREPYMGAWQRNDEWTVETVFSHPIVYACITQISSDIGKLRAKLVELDNDGIWNETTSAAFSPVLKRPNRYQNHIQFKQWWFMSKLSRGNTYAIKQRDNRGVVTALYILDPTKVQPLVSPDGSIFYQLSVDNLNGITEEAAVAVPAREIIHDRMCPVFHPLMGVSPLFAGGIPAHLGLKIINDSMNFFANGANPGGVLTAPGSISDETAKRLQEKWTANFTGENAGKVAVMGDGLKYEPMRMTAVDAQTTEQSRRLDEYICSTFHMPAYLVGVGSAPAGKKPGELKQDYYDECLHSLIEEFELCMDEGLSMPERYATELDLDVLLRMDEATQVTTLAAAVGGSIMAPNEARKRLNMKKIVGGDTVYLQQQNYSLAALDERDKTNPLAAQPPAPVVEPNEYDDEELAAEETRQFLALFQKGLTHAA